MAEPIIETKEPVTPVVPKTPVVKENGAKPVVFSELSPEIQKYIDQERTKASKTARENASKDPDILAKVKQSVEDEAKLTVEQLYAKKLDELTIHENTLNAKELLHNGGLDDDDITDIIPLIVSKDSDKTKENAEKFVNAFNSAVEKNVSTQMQNKLKQTFKPKTPVSISKDFKDLTYSERLELSKTDPARFKIESTASSAHI